MGVAADVAARVEGVRQESARPVEGRVVAMFPLGEHDVHVRILISSHLEELDRDVLIPHGEGASDRPVGVLYAEPGRVVLDSAVKESLLRFSPQQTESDS